MKNKLKSVKRGSKIAASLQAQSQARSDPASEPNPECEKAKLLTCAILTIPLAQRVKLPPKAEDAVVQLAADAGCKVGLGEVRRQIARLANAPNPLIRRNGAEWRLTAAGRKEHDALLIEDLARRREAREHSAAVAWREMEDAVYQAIGCLSLLQQRIEHKLIEAGGESNSREACGIYHLSEVTSDRLNAAFNSVHHLASAN
jgi:hypothetical protein